MKRAGILFFTIITIALLAPWSWASDSDSKDMEYKWLQPPDEDWTGIDIRCDRNDGMPRTLADDFLCDEQGPILDVHFWGSWKWDEKGEIEIIHLSIHDDIPAEVSPTQYSMPGDLRWEMDFLPGEFNENLYATVLDGEWWWDPYFGELLHPGDFQIWQYDIDIPLERCFLQEGTPNDPKVYWLDIWVKTTFGEFGWKTSIDHWNDDAVYWIDDDPYWYELKYPFGHPYFPESIDMAFAITTYKGSLWADTYFISAMAGGTVNLFLDAGPAYAGRNYHVLGSLSGTTPGTMTPSGHILPLNWDFWTDFTLNYANSIYFPNFRSTLDAMGRSTAQINAPATGPTAIGVRMYYAFTLYNPFGYTSNAIAIDFN
ncbi:MAG: hypothetical protein KJ645_01890 [Planctomycetes bacterium]|nr:hypothetical protein [Planctomycetota bacterium]